ncbi:MAG: ACT domain-containing protein [Cyanobacteria bacterium SIG30]|nr:ACT domain-containing protein [Cyanobacteria bacterium SIG30]
MSKQRIIVTISGLDKIGIVASVSAKLAELNVNIEDIKQTIMQDFFVMVMLCDISNSAKSFKEIKDEIIENSEKLGMEAWIQKKDIFDKMHTI